MKAIARKTKPVEPAIADVWHHPLGKPLGYCELRHQGRVVAVVDAVNHRGYGAIQACDWHYQVFGQDGRIVEEGTVDHGVQARERAYRGAERLRKRGS